MRPIYFLWLLLLSVKAQAQQDGIYRDLSIALTEPEKVLTLDLSGSGLTEIPLEIQTFPNLEGLFLQNNNIKTVPGWISKNKNLQRLVLDNNPGLDLKTSLENLRELSLHYLSFNNCNIDFIPAALATQTELTALNAAGNYIAEIPEHIGELQSLTEMDLHNNPVQRISPLLWNCTALKKLDLSGRPLSNTDTVVAVLCALTRLETLIMDYTPCKLYDRLPCHTLVLRHAGITPDFPVEKMQVKKLCLEESNITGSDKFIKKIALNSGLEGLSLKNCNLDQSITGISRCHNLDELYLEKCPLKETGELQQLVGLKNLTIKSCSMNQQQAEDLAAALPSTKVHAEIDAQSYPFSIGPVNNIQVPVKSYTFNADRPGTIQTSNVRLNIPADAFVNQKGESVKGNVQVNYREFFDPVSIALSGINMRTDTVPGGEFMSSAGMFEINASKDGQTLSLAPGSKITAEIKPVQTGQDFSFFQSDGDSWTNVQKNVPFDSLGEVGKAAWRRKNLNQRPVFNMVKPQYHLQKPYIVIGKGPEFAIHIKNLDRDYTRQEKANRNYIAFPEIDFLDRYSFRYHGNCYKDDKKELDSINKIISCLNPANGPNKYIPASFECVNIVPDRSQDCYQLVIRFRGNNYTYPVILEEQGRSNVKIQENNRSFYSKWQRIQTKDDRQERLKRYMKDEETYALAYAAYKKKLDSLGFTDYGVGFAFGSTVDYQLSSVYMSKFNLTKLNKYNIDRLMKDPNTANILAAYQLDTIKVRPELVILVDESLNTAFSFGGEDNLLYNPSNRCSLIAVIDDNTIGICRRDKMKKAADTNLIQLEKIDTRNKNIDDIRKML